MNDWRLAADVGGSTASFARARTDGSLDAVARYPVRRYPSFMVALETYLAHSGGIAGCSGVAIAAAGPLIDGAIRLTNGTWRVDTRTLTERFGKIPVRLMNDLTAVASALPRLAADAVVAVGETGAVVASDASKLAINAGTGFGAAVLATPVSGPLALASEAGHMSLPSPRTLQLGALRDGDPPFQCIEDVLSGPGLARLYGWISGEREGTVSGPAPAEIFARLDRDDAARETLRAFTILLGQVVGDLVLAHGAWGGAYLCGGIARAWLAVADAGLFREHMTAKGKMSTIMATVPTFCIIDDDAALLGLSCRAG